MWYIRTHRHEASKNILLSTKPLLIVPILAIFCKKNQHFFWQKQYFYSKQYCESCVRDFLVMFSVFVRYNVAVDKNVCFTGYVSEMRLPDCSKLALNLKNDKNFIICRNGIILIFLALFCFSCHVQGLSQVSCQYPHWFWKYDNCFIRAWPEIRKLENLKKFCPIFGDCEELRIPNVTLMFLIKYY